MHNQIALPNQQRTTIQAQTSNLRAELEQLQYQFDVFSALLKLVIIVCAGLAVFYFIPFAQQQSISALIISLSFLMITIVSFILLRTTTLATLGMNARIWLAAALWVVSSFGLLQQTNEYLLISALGGTIIVVLAIFLETQRAALVWALLTILGYIAALVLRPLIQFPAFDLGVVRDIVVYSIPIVVLFILATVGRVTTQYLRASWLRADARTRQLEQQEKQLRAITTEAQEARAKAEESDRVKSAFLASMSHELRTPLNAVINFTRFVLEQDAGPTNEEQTELLTEVVNSGKHLLNLINDVLDMSKIEAGSLSLFIEDGVDLNNIFDTLTATARSLLVDKPIVIKTEIEPDLPTLRGDRQRIFQIFLNILANACKFTEQGEIVITAKRSGDKVLVSFKDTGPGIANSDQALVFSAFKQTQTGLRGSGGTGLGMAISKSLAEAHKGQIWLHSELGRGSTFFVSLPIKAAELVPSIS
ncbi:MAG: ATP-binding protein [Anaerolineae bacterium]